MTEFTVNTFYMGVKACFVLVFLFAASTVFSVDFASTEASGTLIVTYQTGNRAERLDRVRFLVKDSQHQQQMYPKGKAYVDDESCLNRMVVIEDLPRGEYTLEFVLPNHDQLFEEVPLRKFTITNDEVVKIDQVVTVRYASLQATAQTAPNAPAFTTLPWITLQDEGLQIEPQSAENKLNAANLLPGTYTVVFQELPGYATPAPIQIKLAPSQNAGPVVGVYSTGPGLQ